MATLPTGTVTFLFTDIEESTTIWQQHPDAMPSALARHHDILRRATESHQGYIFQIVGDAFGQNANPPELARLETAICLLGAADALRPIGDSQMTPEETAEYASEKE